jgi:hypothetical protein
MADGIVQRRRVMVNIRTAVIARSESDEAIHIFFSRKQWIASLRSQRGQEKRPGLLPAFLLCSPDAAQRETVRC